MKEPLNVEFSQTPRLPVFQLFQLRGSAIRWNSRSKSSRKFPLSPNSNRGRRDLCHSLSSNSIAKSIAKDAWNWRNSRIPSNSALPNSSGLQTELLRIRRGIAEFVRISSGIPNCLEFDAELPDSVEFHSEFLGIRQEIAEIVRIASGVA